MAEADAATRVNALERAIVWLGVLNHWLGRVARDVAAALIALMTIAVLAQVFFRYVLNDSLAWSEDTAILAAIWVAFLVAPWAYRQGGHVSIELFVSPLPERLFRLTRVIVNLLVLWLLWRFFAESLKYVESGWRMRANTIPMPVAWFRMIVPVSLVGLALVGIELIARDIYSVFRPSRAMPMPHLPEPIEPE